MAAKSKFTQLDPEHKYMPPTKADGPLLYRTRKKWAINLCSHLTRNQERAVCSPFLVRTKRDDLADAFLYALAFLRRSNVVVNGDDAKGA